MVLPLRPRKCAVLDRGLAALRLRGAGHPHLRMERPEAREENRDHQRRAWRRQCRPLALWGREAGRDRCGRGRQSVASDVPQQQPVRSEQQVSLYGRVMKAVCTTAQRETRTVMGWFFFFFDRVQKFLCVWGGEYGRRNI